MKFEILLLRQIVALMALTSSTPLMAREEIPDFRHYEPSVELVRIDTQDAPDIDGDLSDPIWLKAARIDTFYQIEPIEGATPSERTIVYVAYDESNLYFAFHCFDNEPGKITANVMQRDRKLWQDDSVRVYLDPYSSNRDAITFIVNSLGTKMDYLLENNSNIFPEWDAIWETKARITDDGWQAEMAIPFRSISFDPSADAWGLEILREIRRKDEVIRWSQINQSLGHSDVSRIGSMRGIQDTHRGLGLDVQAFATGIYKKDQIQQPSDENLDADASANIFYKITPSLTGTLTFNTDFSDTPLDERLVNTGRFALFFPETRDFFLQDISVFEFGGNALTPPGTRVNGLPFFSRRIGSASNEVVDLLAGAKLSGRVGKLNVGLLTTQMDKTDNIDSQTLSVARVSADVLNESRIGAIITNGNPNGSGDNTLAGLDFKYLNSNMLNLGGRFLADLFYQRSFSDDFIGPGAGKDDDMFGLFLGYPNDRVRWAISAKEVGEYFDPALGFANRRGIRDYNAHLVKRKRTKTGWMRWWEVGLEGNLVTNLNNVTESQTISIVSALQNQSGDKLTIKISESKENLVQPFSIARKLPVPANNYDFNQIDVSLGAAGSRRISPRIGVICCRIFDGDYLRVTSGLEYKHSKHFRLTAQFNMEKFELPAGDLTVRIGSLDSSVNFNPDMQIDTQIQYDNISERFSFSSRFRWFPQPQTEFFVALGHSAHIDSGNFPRGHDPELTQLIVRLGHTLRF